MTDKERIYDERIAKLREKKLKQTAAKIAKEGFSDEDDYGSVLPPEDFTWRPVLNHPGGQMFYGIEGWKTNFCNLMEQYPTYVDPLDALAGRWMVILQRANPLEWNPDLDYSFLWEDQQKYDLIPGIGKMHHFGKDLRIGLALGWGGILDKVNRYRIRNGNEPFYEAEAATIRAIQGWMRRTCEQIRRLIPDQPDRGLRQNLMEMLEANEWLIDNPPRNLREACQWMAWFTMASRTYNRDGAGGQLDELLRPFYEKDRAEGRIDDCDAVYYLACLLLNDPQYYQLGGPDEAGRDLTSKMSYLILDAADKLNTSINLTIRVHEGLPQALFRKGVECLVKNKNGWPRFSGDQALVAGFMRNGYDIKLARKRIAVGCSWMSLPGLEYTMNDTIKINMAKVFEVAWREILAQASAPSLEELIARFETHLRRAVLCIAKGIDFHLKNQKYNAPELLLNLLSHGPLEKGRDVADGGATYYNICCDGAGLATVADSLSAVEQRVVIENKLSWRELDYHMQNDFAGREGERVRQLLRHSERFGGGESRGDHWARWLSQLFTGIVAGSRTPDGYLMIPGFFSWSNTVKFGMTVGATPNGRHAYAPISHGANPDPGFRHDGAVTAFATAIAQIQPGRGNTAPMQLELDLGALRGEAGVTKIMSLLRTHFDLGGTLVNINIVDAAKIRAAHQNPELYPDLVVRVTGFTAYFASLSPQFRQLVVDRLIAGD